MFRIAKKLASRYRERVLSLVLLPAFFVGTLPQTACICADGHREASCPVMRRQATDAVRTCCQKQPSPQRNCCKNKAAQPAAVCHVAAQTASCCHPVIEAPATATVVKQGRVVEQSKLAAATTAAPIFILASEFWPAIAPTIDSTPPPRDVVIEFSRLTI